MPRFLDIDYLRQAVQCHKLVLNRMLLTVPHHLEQVHCYVHRGIIPDTAYLEPWMRAKPMQNDKLSMESDICDDFQALKMFHGVSDIELYYSSIGNTEKSHLGWLEVVPSSNPSSQSSLEGEILADALQQYDTCAGMETFCREPLYPSICDDQKVLPLEDLESSSYLQEYLLNMPRSDVLLGRLRPKVIKDPFIDENGNEITHKKLFGEDLVFSIDNRHSSLTVDVTCVDEIFHCETIGLEMPGMIEEELTLVSQQTSQKDAQDQIVPGSQQLREILELEEEVLSSDVEDQTREDMKTLLPANRRLDLHMAEKIQCDSSEPSQEKEKSFTDFNDQDVSPKVITSIEKAVLESPALLETILNIPDEYKRPWKQHTMHEISLDNEWAILTNTQKDQMIKLLWNSEKYFSDVITMRLPEPEIKINYVEYLLPLNVMKLLLLKPIACDVGLELDLTWDPIADGTSGAISWERLQLHWDITDHDLFIRGTLEDYDKYNLCDEGNENFLEGKNAAHETGLFAMMHRSHALVDNVIQSKEENTSNKLPQKNTPQYKKSLPKSARCAMPQQSGDFQLDHFLMMTTGEITAAHQHTPDKPSANIASSGNTELEKKETSVTNQMRLYPDETASSNNLSHDKAAVSPSNTQSDMGKKRPKVQIVEIFPSESLSCVLHWIVGCAQPMLSQLISEGLLPTAQEFTTLKPNITHYMVKQHEKTCKDSGETEITTTYCAVQSLHVLTCVFDLALNMSLPTAVSYLSSCQEKYKHLTGSLGKLRQQLFEEHDKQLQTQELHPKLASLCTELAIWLAKKEKKSPGHDPKILIILKKEVPSLIQNLADVLNTLDNVNSYNMMTHKPSTSQDILTKLDTHNCLLCMEVILQNNFPWAQFSIVVEYEHNPQQMQWLHLCNRQNIRFLGLVSVYQGQTKKADTVGTGLITNSEKITNPEHSKHAPLIVLGSQKLTNQQELLKLLESRHNITVYERDYSMIKQNNLVYGDLILDERQCIILEDVSKISEGIHNERLTERILGLSLQFLQCWILVLPMQIKDKNQYSYGGEVIARLAELQGIISVLTRQIQDFQVKVVYCCSIDETSAVIRQICTMASRSTPVWSIEEWTNRNWLTQGMTKHEKFLLSIPSINSFSAQILLTTGSLKTILTMDSIELVKACPWLPRPILQHFYMYMNMDESVQDAKLSSMGSHMVSDVGAPELNVPSLGDDMLSMPSDDEDETLETIALIPSQPGPNEFEKSELGLMEQDCCRPMNVYNNNSRSFSVDGLNNDGSGNWQLSFAQQNGTESNWVSTERLCQDVKTETDLQATHLKSAEVKSVMIHPGKGLHNLPGNLTKAWSQVGAGMSGIKHKLQSTDLGAAGDGLWNMDNYADKIALGEQIGDSIQTLQGSEQPLSYRTYPNRRHAKLWTQFDDVNASNAFVKQLQNPTEKRLQTAAEALFQKDTPPCKSQQQIIFHNSVTGKLPHAIDAQPNNSTEHGYQNQTVYKISHSSDWSLKNSLSQRYHHEIQQPSGQIPLMEQTFSNAMEQKLSYYDPEMQRESLPVRFQARPMMPKTPGIAPVTPRIRPLWAQDPASDLHRVQPSLQALEVNTTEDHYYRGVPSRRPIYCEDSPPIDLGSPGRSLVPMHQRMSSRNTETYNLDRRHITLTPSKKRRLTYEKVPGKKGQTRLNFI